MYYRTHELDMYNLGGLWRNMPIPALGLFIAVCGIAGIPGFNGFASKTILHHAILEAYDFSGHGGHAKDGWLKFIEIIFMLTAGGTFASNIKLFMLTFMGERPARYEHVEAPPAPIHVAIGLISACIILVGLFPNWMLERFIGPALAYFKFDPGSHAYHQLYNLHASGQHSVIPILYPMTAAIGEGALVVHNLAGAGTALMLGGMYFIPGMRFGLFHATVPERWQLEFYYRRVYSTFVWVCQNPVSAVGALVNTMVSWVLSVFPWVMRQPVSSGTVRAYDAAERVIVWLMVKLWQPFTVADGPINTLSRNIFEPLALKVPWQDRVAAVYVAFCEGTKVLDSAVVDGAVNATAQATYAVGEECRKPQTGLLHQYAQMVALGLLILVSLSLYYL